MTDITVHTQTYLAEDQSWLASRHGTENCRTITLDLSLFDASYYPNGVIPSGIVLGKTAGGLYGPYTGTTEEVQTVTVSGAPTGGTFTLTFGGQITAAIPYNATAAQVATALQALSSIGAGNVKVTGNAGGPWTVTFQGTLANTDVAQMTHTDSLTGGSSPAVAVATTTAGGADIGSDGRQKAVGHLFTMARVRWNNTTGKVGAALLEHGFVLQSALPANSGLDPNAITDLAGRIYYR